YYFGSVEHRQAHGNVLHHFVVPTQEERGLRVSPSAGGFVPIGQLEQFFTNRNPQYSSQAGKGVFDLYPFPNNPTGPFLSHTYSPTKVADATGDGFSIKTDWYPTQSHTFTARYNLTDDHSVLPFTSDAINSSLSTQTRTQNFALFFNSTGPQFGN